MDAIKLKSKFITKLISKLIAKQIKESLEMDTDLGLNELEVAIGKERTNIHINLDLEVNNKDLMKKLCEKLLFEEEIYYEEEAKS